MPHCNKKMLSFFLTTKCNLCCIYCYNAKTRNEIKEHTLPFEIAKAGIDWYFEKNDSRHIRFYGPGEPTQEFELLKKIQIMQSLTQIEAKMLLLKSKQMGFSQKIYVNGP